MAGEPVSVPEWQTLTGEQTRRWTEVLDHLVAVLPPGAATVVVDGGTPHSAVVAERLADTLHRLGRPCARLTDTTPLADEDSWHTDRTPDTVAIADGPRWRARPPTGKWDVVIWLRTPPVDPTAHRSGGNGCDVVVDLHDPGWPVIRQIADRLASLERWYLSESRAFFAIRAATWDTRFGDDLPAYRAAVTEARLPADGVAVDIGCGTGRALPALRHAVGPNGTVIGLDITPQMLASAATHSRDAAATLVLGDARHLPFGDATVDVIFAAGLITHLPDPEAGLLELARTTRPGGRLVLFHPSGRAALAARHGRTLDPDEPLAEAPLRRSTLHSGWQLTSYDDSEHRFLATATRQSN
ncbi:class I SAM-dependent methyltransferase [Micromonospora sp. 067-2]|uniref:class I SAM-dependent methyltransferase n=1 Tax=Micromonospora sp. 067-2 TaxID=2789270 RepID=UPI00397B5DC8